MIAKITSEDKFLEVVMQPSEGLKQLAKDVLEEAEPHIRRNITATSIANALARGEIYTTEDLCDAPFEKLRVLRNIGFYKLRILIIMRSKARGLI